MMQVRIGNVIEYEGKLVHVVKSVHGAGQGRQLGNVQVPLVASPTLEEWPWPNMPYDPQIVLQMELRDIKSKRKHNVRFRTSDMVERVKLETKDYAVLYTEGENNFLLHEEGLCARNCKYTLASLGHLDSCQGDGPCAAGETVHLMDDSFEQVQVDKQIFGDQGKWLVDGLEMTVDILQSGEPVTGGLQKTIQESPKNAITQALLILILPKA